MLPLSIVLVLLPRKPQQPNWSGAISLGGFRNSKAWRCMLWPACGLRVHLLQVSSEGHLDEFAGSELSAFCLQPAGALVRGIYMLAWSSPFGLLISVLLCI